MNIKKSPHKELHPIQDNSRIINYLRISITDRCNLACRYCVPKELLPNLAHKEIARYEEILKIVECAADLGITKLRVTGGEPLVRKGVFSFIKSLSRIPGIQEIALTTNGVLLEKSVPKLVDAGIHRVNISLDTLKPDRFKFISGRDCFDTVWRGIMSAIENGLYPVKLNAVVLKGINDDEIESLAKLSMEYPIHMRFIEYMPIGNSDVELSQQMLIPEIKEQIEQRLGALEPVTPTLFCESDEYLKKKENGGVLVSKSGAASPDAGPAKRYRLDGAKGEIGFISPVSSHFCHECNRLRLTSTGKLRPCLLKDIEKDILTPLRAGVSSDELKKIIVAAVQKKPAVHAMTMKPKITGGSSRRKKDSSTEEHPCEKVPSQMSTIGG